MNIGLVTDSTADIPLEVQAHHGIEVVPALININGRSYEDAVEISRDEFYTRLPDLKPHPTTSAPSTGAFIQRYEKLLMNGAEQVVSVHAANSLSGIFNAARLAAQEFGTRVKVIDSEQLSLGIGFQVLASAEAIARGAKLEELLSIMDSIRKRIRVLALLDSMEYIRRSGRVSWTKAMIGTLLHIRPLVELRHGTIHRLGQTRTRHQGVARLKEILSSLGPLERLAILHTNAETAARQFLEDVRTFTPTMPFVINVTTTIGTHAGPNGLGFAAVPLV
jgi:DegV family protein with EDD domain